jgi:hypothetical protein
MIKTDENTYTDVNNALVVLYENCCANREEGEGWSEVWSGSFNRADLTASFKETVRPEVERYFRSRLSGLSDHSVEVLDIFYALAQMEDDPDVGVYTGCNVLSENGYWLEGLNPNLFENHLVEGADLSKLPLIRARETVISRVAEHLSHLVFKTTVAERHAGGYAVVAEYTRFLPFGGYEDHGS